MTGSRWRCAVCGYVHEGAAAPPLCPVCGADRSRFVLLEEPKPAFLRDLYETVVVHAVGAHFPNALVPVAVLFLVLAVFSSGPHFEPAAFYLLLVVLFTAPVSMVSGIYDWRTKYGGAKAPIFYKKIALAVALFILTLAAVRLRLTHPGLMEHSGPLKLKLAYLGLVALLFPIVGLLGHYGGKLVFHWKNKNS